jgi:hypothetical protein
MKSTYNEAAFAEMTYVYTDAMAELLIKKQKDYGPKNISLAPGGPLNGLRVRMFDKLSRINNLLESGATPENESIRDSFIDLANYAVIAMMVLDNNWDTTKYEDNRRDNKGI